MNNFLKRTVSGIGFAAIMLAAFLTNEYVFGAVMLLCLIVMMWEFLRMTCGTDYKYSQILSILAGATLFSLVYCYKAFAFPGRLIILSFVPVFLLMINSLYVKDKSRFEKFANLYTAILYIAVPWSVLNFAVFSPTGEFNGTLLLCFFCIIWGSDVGAYLFPAFSAHSTANICNYVAMAMLLHVTGVYGDLIESQWKRHYNVKDSGNTIPGHGGFLDRFDSALIAIPIGVIYLVVAHVLHL